MAASFLIYADLLLRILFWNQYHLFLAWKKNLLHLLVSLSSFHETSVLVEMFFWKCFFIKGKNVPGNGLWILSSRRWLAKLCLFYKIAVNKSPNYLYNYVSTDNQSYQTRSGSKFLHKCRRTEYFANSLFPYTIKEWNTLCPEICKSVL